MAVAYMGKKMYPEAIEQFKIAGQLSGEQYEIDSAAALEQGFRAAGWKGALTKSLEVELAQRKKSYASPYRIASLYAQLADKDHAFEWLDVAVKERDEQILNLRTDFTMDQLRSDPRFAEQLRKVGFPQ
jgi:hypothetical protein